MLEEEDSGLQMLQFLDFFKSENLWENLDDQLLKKGGQNLIFGEPPVVCDVCGIFPEGIAKGSCFTLAGGGAVMLVDHRRHRSQPVPEWLVEQKIPQDQDLIAIRME